MRARYRRELRWKVRRVHPSDLQKALQKLTDTGWDVAGNPYVHQGKFVIVATRRVRVKV